MNARAGAAAAVATLTLVTAAGLTPGDPAEARARPAAELEKGLALAGPIAAPWPSRQGPSGSFPDYMAARGSRTRDLYGDAMLGYGLLKVGIQRRDHRAVSAGLKGLAYAVAHPRPFHSIVFEKLALAAGYNLASEQLATHPVFTANRSGWESRLRGMKPTWLGRGRSHYFNQHLVDAVLVIELARSGLRSRLPGTVSSDPGRGLRLAAALVNSRLPAVLRSHTARGALTGATTLAPDGALAYHALTLGFYARAVRLLGRRATPRAHALLGRLARGTWALAGPDGDVSYFGRSQEQAWTLPLTSYGAEVAAADAGPAWAERHRATSRRVLDRLLAVHSGGPNGLYLTPAFRADPTAAVRAQEAYVSGTAYSGLTLLGLAWANDRLGVGSRRTGRLAADERSGTLLDQGPRRFAIVSTGTVWYVVRQAPNAPGELGSGPGLVALKVRARGGRWVDVLPHAARAHGTDSAGPLRRMAGGGAAIPLGRGLRLARGASVRLAADLPIPSGVGLRSTTIVVAPGRCGVRVAPGARPGERWEYSAFLPASPRPVRLGKKAVAGRDIRIGYRGAGHIVTGGGSLSPSQGPLVRSRMSVKGPVVFSVGLRRNCGR